ncbi:MAG: hypothetical protein NZ914_05390 [Gemmatales bacterium]|nr:hypothetical protein [Gemmatales bacterium]
MRAWATKVLLGLLLALTCTPTHGQVLVGTIRSFDDLLDTVKYFAHLAGRDDVARQLEPLLDTLTGGKGLIGLDRKKPFGFYLERLALLGPTPPVILFLPTTRQDDFIELLRALNSQVEQPDAQGIREVTLPTGQRAYLRFDHGYAFISLDSQALARQLPDPKRLNAENQNRPLLMLVIRMREIPSAHRKQLAAQVQKMVFAGEQKELEELDFNNFLLQLVVQALQQHAMQLFLDLEEVRVTADLDKANHQVQVHVDITVSPRSPSEEFARAWSQIPSRFHSLRDPRGSNVFGTLPLQGPWRHAADRLARHIEKAIAQKPSDQQKLLRRLYEGILPTLQSEALELALLLRGPTTDDKLVAVAAVRLREGEKLEWALREIYKVLPVEAKAPFRIDAHQLDGRKIHEVRMAPVDPAFMRVFGEGKLMFTVGGDFLLVSLGKHANEALKEALTQLNREQPAQSVFVQVSLRQLALLGQDDPGGKQFRQAVERTFVGADAHRDQLRLIQECKGNRLSFRMEFPTLLFRAVILANQP